MTDLCAIARNSLIHHLCGHRSALPYPVCGIRAACFVTLRDASDQLRGCIGTLEPTQPDLAQEVAQNAISAATRDHRFNALSFNDLSSTRIEVSVLAEPEACSFQDLDPKIYGVVVVKGHLRGVLLPDIEGIESAETQVDIARRKAQIAPSDAVRLFRFQVEKHVES